MLEERAGPRRLACAPLRRLEEFEEDGRRAGTREQPFRAAQHAGLEALDINLEHTDRRHALFLEQTIKPGRRNRDWPHAVGLAEPARPEGVAGAAKKVTRRWSRRTPRLRRPRRWRPRFGRDSGADSRRLAATLRLQSRGPRIRRASLQAQRILRSSRRHQRRRHRGAIDQAATPVPSARRRRR